MTSIGSVAFLLTPQPDRRAQRRWAPRWGASVTGYEVIELEPPHFTLSLFLACSWLQESGAGSHSSCLNGSVRLKSTGLTSLGSLARLSCGAYTSV